MPEFNFYWCVLSGCNCCFIKQKLLLEIREVTTLLSSDRKITLYSKLVRCFLECSSCWFASNCCNNFFIRKIGIMEIKGVTTLLGNDGKIMSNHKLVRCLFRSPWHAVSDSSFQFCLIYFEWLDLRKNLDGGQMISNHKLVSSFFRMAFLEAINI